MVTMGRWSGKDYIGTRYNEYFILYTHHRDSGVLDESNFRSIIKYLKKNKIPFKVARSTHFAAGWVEQILIHERNKKAVIAGNEILDKLERYPIFDEFDFSDLESEKEHEILDEIMKDIENLDEDEELHGWSGITRDMTEEQILDRIMDSGMVEI